MKLRAVLVAVAMTACAPAPTTSPPTTGTPPPVTSPRPAPATSTATATTATTAAVATAGLAATDRLERAHRLAQALPHATAHYRIDFTVAADGRLALTVTLLAVLNGPRDLAAYQADLRRFRAEALAFIAAQGDDPTTYTVTFSPDPTTTSPKEGP